MLSAHVHNLAQYVGKGRQQPTGGMQLESSRSTLQREGYVLYRALVNDCVHNYYNYTGPSPSRWSALPSPSGPSHSPHYATPPSHGGVSGDDRQSFLPPPPSHSQARSNPAPYQYDQVRVMHLIHYYSSLISTLTPSFQCKSKAGGHGIRNHMTLHHNDTGAKVTFRRQPCSNFQGYFALYYKKLIITR